MKLEKNMYVRTKQGYIAKFKEYDEIFNVLRFETPIFLRSWMPCDYMQKDRFMNRYFLKASHNIIDLIEARDVIIDKEGHKYPINYEFEIDYNDEYKSYEITIDDHITLFLKDGLSIVTSQQFESMSYKIGD